MVEKLVPYEYQSVEKLRAVVDEIKIQLGNILESDRDYVTHKQAAILHQNIMDIAVTNLSAKVLVIHDSEEKSQVQQLNMEMFELRDQLDEFMHARKQNKKATDSGKNTGNSKLAKQVVQRGRGSANNSVQPKLEKTDESANLPNKVLYAWFHLSDSIEAIYEECTAEQATDKAIEAYWKARDNFLKFHEGVSTEMYGSSYVDLMYVLFDAKKAIDASSKDHLAIKNKVKPLTRGLRVAMQSLEKYAPSESAA